jgi:hypothetical protein
VRRIRRGEALLGIGAIGLLGLMFADWFSGGGTSCTGWSSLGWALVAMIVALIAMALVTVATTVAPVRPAVPVAAGVITAAFSILTLLVALVRVLVAQPDLGLGLSNAAVSIDTAGYLGLVALVLIVAGAWITIGDERTGAPEAAYTPPPPRPVPGP